MGKYNLDMEARADMARAFFKKGYNCCQSVALAYSDVIGMDETAIAAMGSGFGGGFGRLREVCGCVSGMTLVAGAALPSTDPSDMQRRSANYELVQKLANRYKEENGSIICRELLGLEKTVKTEESMPSARTDEYYKKRPCPELCACATRILAETLNSL
ncbi:MAG: C_GCAxxG_C_C family protein [Bacteroidales bacterium]|nr:C_GCAxxG_C_C family protein [Candidatus Cryptobacteroides caccocaballi]